MEKRTYDTPKVKVVAFQVEGGFAGSVENKMIGNPNRISQSTDYGTQQMEMVDSYF